MIYHVAGELPFLPSLPCVPNPTLEFIKSTLFLSPNPSTPPLQYSPLNTPPQYFLLTLSAKLLPSSSTTLAGVCTRLSLALPPLLLRL